jgi:SnoaL-like protein
VPSDGSGEGNAAAVRRLWERIEARDWPAVEAAIAADAVIAWPHSGERIRGPENYAAIMRNYPAQWTAAVEQVVGSGDDVAALVRVESEGSVHYAACFYAVENGVVQGGTEYYLRAGWFDPPAWRAQWVERP